LSEIVPQKRSGNIQRLARGVQKGKVGGEDMHHALPHV